jgi:hypothetical protein
MTFDRDVAVYEALRKELRKFKPLPVRENRRRGEAALPFSAGGGSGGAGAHIHLVRTATQSIAAAGEPISWDNAFVPLSRLGFTDPNVPTTSVEIPANGYYDLEASLGWDTFTGGGTVSIVRTRSGTDVTIWPPDEDPSGGWSATYGRGGDWTAPGLPLKAGDLIKVNINPDDASAQTLASATLALYLVDRGEPLVTYREAVLTSGPVAYWRLDELTGTLAADSAGHASGPFDMTYTGGANLGQAPVMSDGSGNKSFDMDADNGATGADWAAFDFESIIIQKQVSASGDGWEFIRNAAEVSTNRVGATNHGVNGGTLVVGQAYYGVVTYDGTTLRIYLDGVLLDSDATVVSQDANTITVSIGRDSAGTTQAHWNGRLDEVAVYDRALSLAEITEHYEIGKGAV